MFCRFPVALLAVGASTHEDQYSPGSKLGVETGLHETQQMTVSTGRLKQVKATHHLQIFGAGRALDDVWSRANIVDDGSVKPRKHKVSTFLIHL